MHVRDPRQIEPVRGNFGICLSVSQFVAVGFAGSSRVEADLRAGVLSLSYALKE